MIVLSRFLARLIFISAFVLIVPSFGQGLQWEREVLPALAKSKREKKPVLVSIHSEASTQCKTLDAKVYADPKVIAELSKWILVRVDFERNQLFCKQHKIQKAPGILTSPAGSETLEYTVLMTADGAADVPLEPQAFLAWLKLLKR